MMTQKIANGIREAHTKFLNENLEQKDVFKTKEGIVFKLEIQKEYRAEKGVCYEFRTLKEVINLFDELGIKNFENKLKTLWDENQRMENKLFLNFRMRSKTN